MDRAPAIVLTLLAAGLVAFQPPANAALSRHVGDLGATFVSLSISLLIIGVLLVGAGDVGDLRGITGFRPEHLLGGLAGAAIVFISLVTVRTLGVGGVAALLVAGQLLVSVVIDRLGLLHVEQVGLTPARIAGVMLLVAGTVLVTSR